MDQVVRVMNDTGGPDNWSCSYSEPIMKETLEGYTAITEAILRVKVDGNWYDGVGCGTCSSSTQDEIRDSSKILALKRAMENIVQQL